MTFEERTAQAMEAISRIAFATRERLTAELNELATRYNATSDLTERAKATEGVERLLREAETASQPGPTPKRWIVLIGLVAILYVAGIVAYLNGLGSPEYAEVEATRAVLVFTLIVAMLAFGGLLIIRPLFSIEDPVKLQERFRLAREIFMIFAGIFGTIIGFYFGTATATAADPPDLGVPSFAEGKVSVAVEGGRAPFTGAFMLTATSGRVAMEIAGRTLSYSVPGDACPAGATIEVTDGDNRRDSAEVTCPDDDEDSNQTAPTTNGSTTNGAAGNAT
jgi:hypothetical protein